MTPASLLARKRALLQLAGGAMPDTSEVEVSEVPVVPEGEAPEMPEALPAPSRAALTGEPQEATARDLYGEALGKQRTLELLAGLSRAGGTAIQAISGVAPSEGGAAALEQQAKAPVVEYLQRMKLADTERQRGIQETRAAKTAAGKPQKSTDPLSAVSQRYQRAFRAQYTDAPADLIGAITEENYDNLRKVLESDARIDETAAGRKAASARAEADRILRGNLQSNDLDARYAGMTAADERADKALRAAQAYRDAILGQHASDQTQKINERNVGGFTIDPQDPPSPEASKKMADTKIAYDRVKQQIQRLDGMLKTNGSEVIGDKAGEMGVVWSDLTTSLRLFDQMGVPNANDYVVLAKSVTDPTSGEGVKTSTSRMRAQLREVQRKMDLALRATAGAYKFRPADAPVRVPVKQNTVLDDQTTPKETKKYSPGKDTTYVFGAANEVIRTEKGDTRGR